RGLAIPNSERALEVILHLVGAAQHAGGVDADDDVMPALRLREKHGIEGCGRLDEGRRQPERLRDLPHRRVGDIALLVLDRPECRDDRRLLRGIAGGHRLDFGKRLLADGHQRSTSPRMKSMLPMMAITSATSTPCTNRLSGCRLQKD